MKNQPNQPVVAANTAVINFEEDTGLNQTFSREDIALPAIKIIQPNNPALVKNSADQKLLLDSNPGQIIEQGDFTLSSTNQLVKGETGFEFLPINYQRSYVEWTNAPAGQKSEFVKDHASDLSIFVKSTRDKDGNNVLENGNVIAETAKWFGFVIGEDGLQTPAMIFMSSTKMRASKKLATLIDNYRLKNADGASYKPAMFARTYRITSSVESNGTHTWFNFAITAGRNVGEIADGAGIYACAKDYAKNIQDANISLSSKSGFEDEDHVGRKSSDEDDAI